MKLFSHCLTHSHWTSRIPYRSEHPRSVWYASHVVHGSGPKKTLKKPELLDQALNYCYRGIMKRRADSGENGEMDWNVLIMGANR